MSQKTRGVTFRTHCMLQLNEIYIDCVNLACHAKVNAKTNSQNQIKTYCFQLGNINGEENKGKCVFLEDVSNGA